MLTGEMPDKDLKPPSQKVRIDVRLDEVVLRALEQKPDLRYQQASLLKTEVETIAAEAARSEHGRQMAKDEPSAQSDERITRRIKRAAIGLMVIGAINVAYILFMITGTLITTRTAYAPSTTLLTFFAGVTADIIASSWAIYAGFKMFKIECRGIGISGGILTLINPFLWFFNIPVGIWSLIVLNQKKVKKAFSTNQENHAQQMTPHVSLLAIWGATCHAVALMGIIATLDSAARINALALQAPHLSKTEISDRATSLLSLMIGEQILDLAAVIAATLLGWIAISQIRRSSGKMRGLGLAVFDGLLAPLLALAFAIWWLWCVILQELFHVTHHTKIMALPFSMITFIIVAWIVIRRIGRWTKRPLEGGSNTSRWTKWAIGLTTILAIPLTVFVTLNRHEIAADIRSALHCNYYATPFFNPQQLEQLKTGASADQIRDTLGYPLQYQIGKSGTTLWWHYTARPSPNAPYFKLISLGTDLETGKLLHKRAEVDQSGSTMDRYPTLFPMTAEAGTISVSRNQQSHTLTMGPSSDEIYVIITGMQVGSAADLTEEKIREREAFVTASWTDVPRNHIRFVHMVAPKDGITLPELDGLLKQLPDDSPVYSDYGMPHAVFEPRSSPVGSPVHDVMVYCKGTLYHYPEIHADKELEPYYRKDQNWLMHRLVKLFGDNTTMTASARDSTQEQKLQEADRTPQTQSPDLQFREVALTDDTHSPVDILPDPIGCEKDAAGVARSALDGDDMKSVERSKASGSGTLWRMHCSGEGREILA
ncbi:MAG: hypothetical protein JXL20_05505, partial [Deltaproteobacteria bacterium]|nr:hypothetical protein [Deltaproteobacteria bacterium]